MQVTKIDTIEICTAGLSVVGIASRVLEVMETLDTNYPGQYTLRVDPDSQKATIVRRYQEKV